MELQDFYNRFARQAGIPADYLGVSVMQLSAHPVPARPARLAVPLLTPLALALCVFVTATAEEGGNRLLCTR